MAINNHERVGKAMELLKQGLGPFIEREFKNQYRDRAASEALRFLSDDRNLVGRTITEWDVAAMLKLMGGAWNDVFRRTLGGCGTEPR
jgi:Swt1-like HEPN